MGDTVRPFPIPKGGFQQSIEGTPAPCRVLPPTYDLHCSTCGSSTQELVSGPVNERPDQVEHPSKGPLLTSTYRCEQGHETKVLGYAETP